MTALLALRGEATRRVGHESENDMRASCLTAFALALVLSAVVAAVASGQVMPKAQVANLIVKVENGVDEFEKYLERRGENAKDAGAAAQSSGRRSRQEASENQKARAGAKKDKLDDAMGDLNRSTNRLRRKFDADCIAGLHVGMVVVAEAFSI